MGALPLYNPQPAHERKLPDLLPARMVNEFTYCPRLFFYEWVEGLFAHSADTLEGAWQHNRVDQPGGSIDASPQEKIHARSVTLSSERLRVIATLDLVEGEGNRVTPVDYKHGAPKQEASGLIDAWDADKVQVILQALLLREAGFLCDAALVFYQKTRQRVRIAITPAAIAMAEHAVSSAWQVAAAGVIPPPLDDSPKCNGCSLNGICLPDETNLLRAWDPERKQMDLFTGDVPPRKPARSEGEVRRLVTPREERRPLYLNTQGLRVGKSGDVLQIKEKERVVQEARIHELNQVNLYGNIQISTQTLQTLLENEVPVSYFSQGGWFYGMTTGMNTRNVFLRRAQFRLTEDLWFSRKLARSLIAAKIRNQRVLLQRNHIEPRPEWLTALKNAAQDAEEAKDLDSLLGVEGNAARIYFGAFAGMIKAEDGLGTFDFEHRNRRPPRDPVNALLSLAYSMLAKDLTIACYAVGFDPLSGFYHQPRFGRPSLALDLMEPFRPLIADSVVLTALNNGMVASGDFVRQGKSVALTPNGRKGFFRAYELRMDTLVTHPLFDYRVSYRRMLEIQARLLARVLDGELGDYPAFVTR
ncbi:MAG TPA: CRISPR-associated endonuclease Cas1 [Bryobacteraceae bacterium]|nr:CRISPR-associated endonuclease Cas1 [Bryobacteraceae bacterium]